MYVTMIDTLDAQRRMLRSAPDEAQTVYREQVLEPLRPFWELMLRYMPIGTPQTVNDDDDPKATAGKLLALYSPESDSNDGLDALAKLEESASLSDCVQTVEAAVEKLNPQANRVDFPGVKFSMMLADPDTPGFLETQKGVVGSGSYLDWILVTVWPTDYNLPRLPAITAHELHHKVRLAFEPWTDAITVGQYLVLEGLAEAFAAEMFGDEMLGPWSKALTEEELGSARPVMREALEVKGFDEVRGYIFGDFAAAQSGYTPRGLPDFVGYSLGYRMVQEYLRHTNQSVVEATYVPWREIVEESRYL